MPSLFLIYVVCLRLLDVFCKICQAHVTLTQEGVVHGEGGCQFVVRMATPLGGIFQVVLKHGAIVGMSYLDELLGLLHIALVAQVGNTILCDDGIDEVVRVVYVAGERHDAGDGTALGSGAAGEDGEVG